jgi:hypothetical protein
MREWLLVASAVAVGIIVAAVAIVGLDYFMVRILHL